MVSSEISISLDMVNHRKTTSLLYKLKEAFLTKANTNAIFASKKDLDYIIGK